MPLSPTPSQLRAASNAALNSLRAPHHSQGRNPLTVSASCYRSPPFRLPSPISASSFQATRPTHRPRCFSHQRPRAPKSFTRPFTTSFAKMSSMPATGGHSAACCNIPPIVSSGYQKKGEYQTIGDKKTYVTGPTAEANKAILVIMDIFGFFDQTIQGCDILATSDDHHKYAVFMPDAFNGEPMPIENFPPDTEEKQQKLGAFFGKNSPPSFASKIAPFLEAAQEKYPNIKEWGIVGFCWGSKVISLTVSGANNPFKIAAEIHPAMVDAKDAEKIKIPLAMLASKDEPADEVKKFEAALTGPKHVETFADQIHGWMAARSNLKDKRVEEEYIRGYKTVLTFFANNWP